MHRDVGAVRSRGTPAAPSGPARRAKIACLALHPSFSVCLYPYKSRTMDDDEDE